VLLESDKSEGVVKTNVWVEIKRRGKYLQGVEDNFKEKKRKRIVVQATRTENAIDCKLSQA